MRKLLKLSTFVFIISCMFTTTVCASYKDDAEASMMEVMDDLSVIDQSTSNDQIEIEGMYSSALLEKTLEGGFLNANWGMNINDFVAAQVGIDGSYTVCFSMDVDDEDNDVWNSYEYEFQQTIKATEVDGIAINSLNFPNDSFREDVVSGFDSDNNGALSQDEINAATIIDYDRNNISDLTGLEYFTNLETLDIFITASIKSLDLSANTKLKYLTISGDLSSIKSLDLSKNVKLKSLDFGGSMITSLDLTNCTGLTYLFLSGSNYLSSLNIVGLSELKEIYLYNTRLTVLDLRGNESLEYMEHGYTDPSSGCTQIETWYLGDFDFNVSFHDRGVFCSDLVFYEESNDTWDSWLSKYYYGDTAYAYDSNPALSLPKASDYTSSTSSTESTSADSTSTESTSTDNTSADSTSADSISTDSTTNDTTSNEESDTSEETTLIAELEEVFIDGVLEYDIDGITDVSKLTVVSDEITLVFDKEAIASITNAMQEAANEDLYFSDFSIAAIQVDVATLDESIQELVGNRPVFDFSIVTTDSSGNYLEITEFGDGSVIVSIAYELTEDQSSEGLFIYYIDGDTVETIAIDSYDSENGVITFTTSHFSIYAVGYEENTALDDVDTTDDTVIENEETSLDSEAIISEDANTENGLLYVVLVVILVVLAGGGFFIIKKRKLEADITEADITEVDITEVDKTEVDKTE